MQVLAMHLKILSCKTYTLLLSQVTGVSLNDDVTSLSTYDHEVPLLLKDATALLLQLVLTLPLLTDKAYYTCLVQIMYNVAYIQSISILSCKLQGDDRLSWRQDSRELKDECVKTLNGLLGLIVDFLEHCALYEDDTAIEGSRIFCSVEAVETCVRETLLPFLRIASLLQHQLFKEALPAVRGATVEFPVLCNYLGLCCKEEADSDKFSSSQCLHWAVDDPKLLIKNWCQDFINFVTSQSTIGRTLLIHNVVWQPAQLLNLPQSYDNIFQHYRKKQCERCSSTPKEPAVCLVCGTFVCLREACCRQQNINEAVVHSISCGAGTAIYLLVNSSTIIVIRGRRACLWGSVYLDSFGEEDRDLKRGKPLYLSEERYKLLEHQWLTHNFNHTNKRWIFHKDSL